ncbi:MAG TPA: TrkA family potassium uptake protein [Cytophagales bacterium]|nr:TrkA family potassium uptake protein [Cytophagales bacterium]
MKYLIIGLGNFGSTLAINLTEMGHEVIAVDKDMNKVNNFKDRITHTICLDAGSKTAMSTLPIKEIDYVIVGIGEDFGASVLSTALLKQLKAKRIISRAISDLHQTVIEAISVDDIIRPEEESAERLAIRLSTKGVVDYFRISTDYSIIEVNLPDFYIGKTVRESELREHFNINILTILRNKERINIIGNKHTESEVIGVVGPNTTFNEGDIVVLFGKMKDINRFIEE